VNAERQDGWHTRVDVDSGRVSWSKERWAVDSGRVRIEMRDTRPIKALLVGTTDAPGWLRLMPTIRELKGQLDLTASPDEFRLSAVQVDGRGTEVRAELMNTAGGHARCRLCQVRDPVGWVRFEVVRTALAVVWRQTMVSARGAFAVVDTGPGRTGGTGHAGGRGSGP
jgi:hypothetical protein